MQEQEENKKDIPMVDIDSSGPDAEIELKDDVQETETEIETTKEEVEESQATSPESEETSGEEKSDNEKKEELENYSKDVQRRIAKLTKKWREAQRQADEAVVFAKTQKDQREAIEKKYSSVEAAGVKDREARITAALDAAQAKLLSARENNDIAAEVEANKQIAMLGYEEARLSEAKLMAEEKSKIEAPSREVPVLNNYQQQTQQVDPKAEEWGAKNKWFGTDSAMTYTAFDIHGKLESEGYDANSDEYYAEIDKRIRLEFPHKFATTGGKVEENTTKPVQQVASATRSTKTSRKTIRLTPTEVAIAKKLGVSLEDYAKQKKIMKEV